MMLPKVRTDLDITWSPVTDRPGLLIRDHYRYSESVLILPPLLIPALQLFDGRHTDLDLQTELTRALGTTEGVTAVAEFIEALSQAGFLQDETYARLKQDRLLAFAKSPVRRAAHAGSSYPAESGALRQVMQQYLQGAPSTQHGVIAIAAPHCSLQGGWESYRAAYKELTPDLRDRTFIVLGTSHYGEPGKFGLTRKPFETPFGRTNIDQALVDQLEAQPAALVEDYCQAIEHSIEFQVVFLQAIYGADVRILPILCGSFARTMHAGQFPEADEHVNRFLGVLGEIAARQKESLFWVLGVDMAHIGIRYGDKFEAHADQDEMVRVKQRDMLRIERLNASDAPGFWDLIKENQDDLRWCGASPLYTFMKTAPQARGTLHRYQQWDIDPGSAVSFAGISFTG